MKRKYVYLYLLGLLLFSVACTGNFRDYNTDLSGITDDDLIIDDNGYGIRLGIIQQGIYSVSYTHLTLPTKQVV